jgi:hypothetical protein
MTSNNIKSFSIFNEKIQFIYQKKAYSHAFFSHFKLSITYFFNMFKIFKDFQKGSRS